MTRHSFGTAGSTTPGYVLWAIVGTIILAVARIWIGTRTFRRQNA